MKKTILLAALALGALSANAADGKKALTIESLLAKGAAPAVASQQQQKHAETFSCDPTGAACYAEDSWTCCSKICEYQLCH